MAVDLVSLSLIVWYVVVLVFLEGVLSADNALVLALMVRHLPKAQQKRALRYGIWGAMGFRVIAVVLSAQLMGFWYFKVAGGLFLLGLAIRHFLSHSGDESEGQSKAFGRGFWGTVISVELADIAFSIDSILAAVAMVDGLPPQFGHSWKLGIVIIGGVLGILTMRFVAAYFIILLDRFKGLENGAYALVVWIGLKLLGSGIHNATDLPTVIPEWLFWIVMGVIVAISMLYRPRAVPETDEKKADPENLVEIANMLGGDEPNE
jgi:YkoY family integral membrane protein